MRKQVEPEWGEQISMQIPVLVESVAGNGFRASGGEPLAISAGGHADEAIARLKSLIADRLAVGAELISLDVTTVGHPLAPCRDGPKAIRSSTSGKRPSRRIAATSRVIQTGDERLYP